MPTVGPTLPPHLQKRKREEDDDTQHQKSAKRRSTSAEAVEKKQRVIGPAMPPAPLDEMPRKDSKDEASASDNDDDFGPALPSAAKCGAEETTDSRPAQDTAVEQEPAKPKRDEWMLAPPGQGDWVSRVDPTKLKNRRFNTSSGPRAPQKSSGGDLWTETPEEKRKRLADEVLGVKQPGSVEKVEVRPAYQEAESQEMDKKVREYNVRSSVLIVASLIRNRRNIEVPR